MRDHDGRPLRLEIACRVGEMARVVATQRCACGCVEVALATEGGRVRLSVIDDGRGFDPAAVADTRYGLRGFPTVILFVKGEEKGRFSSAHPDGWVREFIESHL